MAFIHGKGAAVLVGEYNLSSYFNSADTSSQAETAETTTFGDTAKDYIPGLRDGTISLGGLFDGAANAVDQVLESAIGSASGKAVTVLIQGAGTIGNRARLGLAHQTDYSISSPVADVVSVSAEMQISGGLWGGVLLADLSARVATGNLSSVDNAASSANGAIANLHVTAFTGTNVTIKIQHSSDNATWTDLITFTAATGATSQQQTATGTVNRYLRVTISGTFTSVTFAVACARK